MTDEVWDELMLEYSRGLIEWEVLVAKLKENAKKELIKHVK